MGSREHCGGSGGGGTPQGGLPHKASCFGLEMILSPAEPSLFLGDWVEGVTLPCVGLTEPQPDLLRFRAAGCTPFEFSTRSVIAASLADRSGCFSCWRTQGLSSGADVR